MNQRHYLIKGTFLLTFAGLLTKTAGFFYKIFLSRAIGAKEIGLFQLTVPVYMFCLAASLGGVQVTLSRLTAKYCAKKDRTSARRILYCGLLLSVSVSLALSAGLYLGSEWIASRFLLEPGCSLLLKITAFSLPLASVHSCVSSYFMGKKDVVLSASSQLLEQLLRIGAVMGISVLFQKNGRAMDASVMALGQIAGELASALFCLGYFCLRDTRNPQVSGSAPKDARISGNSKANLRISHGVPEDAKIQENSKTDLRISHGVPEDARLPENSKTDLRISHGVPEDAKIPENAKGNPGYTRQAKSSEPQEDGDAPALSFRAGIRMVASGSLALSLNRMLLCILQAIEASLLPQQLARSGMTSHDALSVYGVLTGMALPLITFPTAITGAVSSLLLPAISEAQVLNQRRKITGTIDAGFHGSLLLGVFFLGAFLLFGEEVGAFLFHNGQAGLFIRRMALLCPFLYINTTLIGILHGLGKTTEVFLCNILSFLIRLGAILFLIPAGGIDGYFAGMLCGYILTTLFSLITLRRASGFLVSLTDGLIKPGLLCLLAAAPVCLMKLAGPSFLGQSLFGLLLLCSAYALLFALLAFLLLLNKKQREEICARLSPKRRRPASRSSARA